MNIILEKFPKGGKKSENSEKERFPIRTSLQIRKVISLSSCGGKNGVNVGIKTKYYLKIRRSNPRFSQTIPKEKKFRVCPTVYVTFKGFATYDGSSNKNLFLSTNDFLSKFKWLTIL